MTYETKTDLLKAGRTGRKLNAVKGIVVHWVANPKSSAAANRNYWENLGTGVSAHDIIDLDGTLLHCAPYEDMCYQVGAPAYTRRALDELSGYPNNCVIGIECTHLDWDGAMTDETYNTLVEHVAWLCKEHGLTRDNIYTHHEIVGAYKDCHRWFTNNPDEWEKFKDKVQDLLDGNKAPKAKIKAHVAPKQSDLLRKGDKGQAVKDMQQLLVKAGADIHVDGIFGPKTATALKEFQLAHDLVVDSIYGPKTKAALESVNYKPKGSAIVPYPGLLKKGSRGHEVERVQRALGITVDGIFGSGTERAVKDYQRRHGLTVDGLVGPASWSTLF